MQWQSLHPVPEESWFSAGLKKQVRQVNRSVDDVLNNRQRFETSLAEARCADPRTFDFYNAVGFPAIRTMLATLLQQELRARDELAKVLDLFYTELSAESEAAGQRHREAQRKIEQGLEAFGYHRPSSTPDPHRYQPIWVAAHPEVFEARQTAKSLFHRANDRERIRANQQAADAVVRELESIKIKALPGS